MVRHNSIFTFFKSVYLAEITLHVMWDVEWKSKALNIQLKNHLQLRVMGLI